MQRRTKIIATLGPATDRPGMLKQVLQAGVDVARLNLSHGSAEDQLNRAKQLRSIAHELGREVAILADLQGPKIRIRNFASGPVLLESGMRFILDCRGEAPLGTLERVGVSYLGLHRDVKVSDTLVLDDGLITLRVENIVDAEIHTTVIDGGMLSDRKGINRLGGGLALDALSEKDKSDIKLAAQMGADFLAVSFVRTASDMQNARALLRAAGSAAALVAKIERAEVLDHLGDIIEASDAVMVARGDLGVEIGFAELPGLQKKIIREALARNRVVITATQMLQSMVESPIPTRAEVLDVANAVIDGSDAVMLSQESASGKYPDKAVAAMRDICLAAERQLDHSAPTAMPRLDRTDQAIAMAAMHLADRVQARAIVALTESGATAQWLSRFRSRVPIYAMSRQVGARQRMSLYRDVYPVAFDPAGSGATHAVKLASELLFAKGLIDAGDRIVLTTGDHTGLLGGTNTLKLLKVGEGGAPEGMAGL